MNLHTQEAKQLHADILDYLFICDDPKYSRLRKFRNRILAIKDTADRLALMYIFEKETNSKMDYYNSEY